MGKIEYFLDGIYEPLNETVKEKADVIKNLSQKTKIGVLIIIIGKEVNLFVYSMKTIKIVK
jgi:hypothetical protein